MPQLATRIESAELAVVELKTGLVRFKAVVVGGTFDFHWAEVMTQLREDTALYLDGEYCHFFLWSCPACLQLWKKPMFGRLPRFCDARCKARHGMRQLRRRRRTATVSI